jgi:hypothetical protein
MNAFPDPVNPRRICRPRQPRLLDPLAHRTYRGHCTYNPPQGSLGPGPCACHMAFMRAGEPTPLTPQVLTPSADPSLGPGMVYHVHYVVLWMLGRRGNPTPSGAPSQRCLLRGKCSCQKGSVRGTRMSVLLAVGDIFALLVLSVGIGFFCTECMHGQYLRTGTIRTVLCPLLEPTPALLRRNMMLSYRPVTGATVIRSVSVS